MASLLVTWHLWTGEDDTLIHVITVHGNVLQLEVQHVPGDCIAVATVSKATIMMFYDQDHDIKLVKCLMMIIIHCLGHARCSQPY